MDAIRKLLLARAHTVVLDPESVASAATRPMRADDVERFEAELAQLGYLISLDLGMTLRRLTRQAIAELRRWVLDTLATTPGAQRPQVPRVQSVTPANPYLGHVLAWLATRPEQPCPWCGQVKLVGALDPCGHLVCRTCWAGGTYAGCPSCHRRVAPGDPFLRPSDSGERVTGHDGALTLLHLGLDVVATARTRLERLLARAMPLSPQDRDEIELVIDAFGPRVAAWLPSRFGVEEAMAIALARLWMVSPDRTAMVTLTAPYVRSATDVLRIAAVLMGGNARFVEPMRLRSLSRGLRRAVLAALDRLPAEQVVEDVRRHPRLWQRVGERLHPFEHAERTPTATLAFAIVRDTDLGAATFGEPLRARAERLASVRIADGRIRVMPWAAPVEDRLRAGDARGATEQLAARPAELLRRVDHLVRVTEARQPDALGDVLGTIEHAVSHGAPAQLLLLAAHLARRSAPWPRRVMFPGGEVLRAWSMPDRRPPLGPRAIAAVVGAIRAELARRAAARRNFARAVIDRGLVDLLLPITRRLRWLDLHVTDRGSSNHAGAYRAALAQIGRDLADFVATRARPTLWDVACVHAAARANIIYVRDGSGAIAMYRRRDSEAPAARLARLLASTDADGALVTIPVANAPTWFALVREDLALPAGSTGYVLETGSRGPDNCVRVAASTLVAELAAR